MKNSCFLATALALATASAACSSDWTGTGGEQGEASPGRSGAVVAPNGSGTVGAQLTLPAGQLIEVVQWVITGPHNAATVVQRGSVSIPNTNVVSFLASGIPAGTGYLISLSGTAIDGSVTCAGSSSFAIQSHETTPVPVVMACTVATSGSQVTLVNGTSFNCADVTNITAVPAETAVGGTIALTAAAAGPISSQLTYAWSAPNGSFSSANTPNTNFTCSVAGPVPLTLVAADGPVPAGSACNAAASTRTVTVTCEAPATDAGATDAGETDAGETPDAGDGGPPLPVPALPGSGVAFLGMAMLALGALGTRRAQGSAR